jgi:hypothetical protein
MGPCFCRGMTSLLHGSQISAKKRALICSR